MNQYKKNDNVFLNIYNILQHLTALDISSEQDVYMTGQARGRVILGRCNF
jgi:hypothetical protein